MSITLENGSVVWLVVTDGLDGYDASGRLYMLWDLDRNTWVEA